MEIKVFLSLENMNSNKAVYCSRVLCPDAFSFEGALSTFRSIYGFSCIVTFVCV